LGCDDVHIQAVVAISQEEFGARNSTPLELHHANAPNLFAKFFLLSSVISATLVMVPENVVVKAEGVLP
jgi:hypothetical protein